MSCRQGSRVSVTCWRQLSLLLLQMSGNCDLSVMSGEAVTHFLSLPSLSSFHCMNENTSCHLPTCFRTAVQRDWPVHDRQSRYAVHIRSKHADMMDAVSGHRLSDILVPPVTESLSVYHVDDNDHYYRLRRLVIIFFSSSPSYSYPIIH